MKMKSVLVALAGIGAALILSSCSMLGIGGSTGDDHPTGEVSESQNLDAFAVEVGDCLDTTSLEDTFSNVPLVPCTQAHDAEIIYVFDMPDGDYDEAAIDAATDGCEAYMQTYVGPNYADAGLYFNAFSPTEDSWAQGDREIDCLATTLDGTATLTATVKDTAL